MSTSSGVADAVGDPGGPWLVALSDSELPSETAAVVVAVLVLLAAAAQRASRKASWLPEAPGGCRAAMGVAEVGSDGETGRRRADVGSHRQSRHLVGALRPGHLSRDLMEDRASARRWYPPQAARTMGMYKRPRCAQSVPMFRCAVATSR